MAGRGHVDDDLLAGNLKQIEDTEDSEEFVDAGWDYIEQCGDDLAIEGKIDVNALHVAAHGLRDLLLNAIGPAAIFGNRIEFGGEKLPVAEDGSCSIVHLGLEDVVERRRRVGGADGDRMFAIG